MRARMAAAVSAWLLAVAPVPAPAQEAGPVTIGGVTVDHVDPGPPFTERQDPAPDWEAPAPTAAETAAGLLAYAPSDPGDCGPARRPRPQEHTGRLSTFLTPGEERAVWFAVQALDDVRGLEATARPGGAPASVEVRHMHFWPQRTGWASRRWYITPELLLPCSGGRRWVPAQRGLLEERPFDVPAGTTAGFWLTVRAPASARPGVYTVAVTVRASGRPELRLPLRLEVLPFRLKPSEGRQWLLYADSARWSTMKEAQILRELRDFARHGISGLVEIPLGTADLSRLKADGTVTFDAAPYRRLAALCRKAGIPGPHVVSPGGIPEKVRDALGIQADLQRGDWPEPIVRGVQAVARAALRATAGEPSTWYYYGVDEPTGENTYAIQDYRCWHDAGARTYATFYRIDFLEKAAEYLLAPCFVAPLVSAEATAARARDECRRTGAEFWWYGTGCYVNPFPQERYMFHNRYGAGLLFWKTGARAEVTWTFCRPHEDVFNDFDGSRVNPGEPKEQVTAYPHFLKPDDWSTYQGAIPTIAWESLREGVFDYRYLATLAARIAELRAGGSAAARKRAERAEARLAEVVRSIPWASPLDAPAFDTALLERARRTVADLIVQLRR